MWQQIYDPLHSKWLSTFIASLPVIVLLGGIGLFHMKAHIAAVAGLAVALLVAIVGYGMPVEMAGKSALWGALFGLLPIGWIILNIIFLYLMTKESGLFEVLQDASPASPTIGACNCCWSHSASAHSLKAPPASARRWRSPARC